MNQYVGIYKYFVKDFRSQEFRSFVVRCVVVGETDKSYEIKLLTPIRRRAAGEKFWIKRKNLIRRSYLVYGTRFCEKYNMEVTEQSCCACIQDCLTKSESRMKAEMNPGIRSRCAK